MRNSRRYSLPFRSSGGYEIGSSDVEEQLLPKFVPHIKGFPIMLVKNLKTNY